MAVGLLAALLYAWAAVVWLVTVFVLAHVTYIWYLHRLYDHIPGPKGKGLLGYIAGHIEAFKKMETTFFAAMVLDWVLEYGYTMKLMFFTNVFVVTVDTNAIKEIMVIKNYVKPASPIYNVLGARFLGAGLAHECDNKVWAKRRSTVNPAFHRSFLKNLVPQFNEKADILMNKLSRDADSNTVVSLLEEMKLVGLDVIAKVSFGMDTNGVEDATSQFSAAIDTAMKVTAAFIKMSPVQKIYHTYNPFYKSELREDITAALHFLRKTGRDLFNKRFEMMAKGNDLPDDMMTYLLQTHDSSDASTEVIIDDFVGFFMAGQETTANTLGFVLMEIGRRPDIMEKLQDEVDAIVCSKPDVTYDDIGKLSYMSMVIKESLRLYPPVPVLMRQSETDVTIGGYHVPAHTQIIVSTYASSRIPEFFPEPLEFKPERFDPKADNRGHTYTTFPFSLGPRNCAGQTFAQIEMRVLLAKMIQRFNIELDPEQSFDIDEKITLRPKGGVMATLSPRS